MSNAARLPGVRGLAFEAWPEFKSKSLEEDLLPEFEGELGFKASHPLTKLSPDRFWRFLRYMTGAKT
jgi:hypothetical protein